jgi:hypothetical protein
MQRHRFLAAAILAALAAAPRCHAAQRLCVGTGVSNETGDALKAQALFDNSGNNLSISLSNISKLDVVNNPDILTGIFFHVTGTQPTLGTGSATIVNQPATAIYNWPSAGNTMTSGFPNIGGEWGVNPDITVPAGFGMPQANEYGIASAGYLDPQTSFPGGSNLSGPSSGSLGGIDWGLTSAGDNISTGHGSVASDPLIKGTVLFTLTGWNGLSLDRISDVRFQYGTSFSEYRDQGVDPPLPANPEPGSLSILGLAIAPLLARLRRRRA